MKILSIRLKNLASIEGYFDIDFTTEPLASAGIFAISGPTGAGKSTILDALCLALYDKTPRFEATSESLYLKDVGESRINQSDVKNILRRGAGEGFAEVVFLGVDGHRYQSRWYVRRARNKPTGSIQAQTIQVIDLNTQQELQGTKTEILNRLTVLTGLTYEQFTRTVLLAQNDFATFLKSRESAKAELLEKLTGTEIYSSISRSVYVHSKQAMEELNQLRSSQNLIEILPEEELAQLQTDKATLTTQRAEAVKQLNLLTEQLKVITTLRKQQELLTRKQAEAAAEAGKLKSLQVLYAERGEQLNLFRQQCEALQPELRQARTLDTQIQTVSVNHAQAEQRYTDARKKREEATKALAAKEQNLCNELRKLNTAPDASATPLPPEKHLQQASALLTAYEKQLQTCQQANDERVSRLNAYGIRSLGEEQNKLLNEQKQLQAARQSVVDWLKLRAEAERIAKELAERHTAREAAEKGLTTLKEQLSTRQQQVQTLQRLYDNARVAISKDVESIRRNLASGEACPVCGSTNHPYAQEHQVVNTLYNDIEKEYKTAADEYQSLNNRAIRMAQDLLHMRQQQEQGQAQLTALQQEAALKTPEKEEERSPEYFDTRLVNLQQQLDTLAGKLKAYQQLYEEWQQHDSEIKKQRHQTDALRETIAACRLLLQQVASGREQVASVLAQETDEQARFAKTTQELEQLRKDRSALLKGKTADEAEAALQRHDKELNRLLEESRLAQEKQQALISGLEGEIRQLALAVEELQKEEEHIQSPEKLSETMESQQVITRELERKLSQVEARLLQQEQNLARFKSIEQELKTKQSTAEQWEKLNKLIGSADGTKFKIIAQSYTLNLLLMHANKHLSYLSKRYRLQQVPDTLALQVIDRDMCDEIRTVYSLSGGESFLISLALALGLSSLSSNNLKVESLFIDEGFGSLDADSLRLAMEALEQLQMQGRKIGVISHVQEMSERIAVQIVVNKLVNGKSEVFLHP